MVEGVLGKIVANKAEELERRFDGVSLDALRSRAQPATRSLRDAIAGPGARFILELKRASPSLGAIAPSADPETVARAYAGVADALSVLTDTRFFGGSIDDLRAARRQFKGPILAKDFFIDPRQVAEARIAGADAILVMLSVLSDAVARRLIEEAGRLGMDALVEVHDEAEMHRALALDAPIIGINNRDLRDLSINLSTTERLAGLAPDRLLISESGIQDRNDVERLAPLVDGFLIGSSLMRSSDPAIAAREVIFGRTKLCGLKSSADIRAACSATHAGFVFVPDSPRHVAVDEAAPLTNLARSMGVRTVGVFRNAKTDEVADAAIALGLDAVQLHGDENANDVDELRRKLPEPAEIWTAVGVDRSIPRGRGGDRTLFDHRSGGTGRSFDWALLAGHPDLSKALIAGGIGPQNAAAARSVGAYAIDVGSSLDSVPGRKCPDRIAGLFEALRPAARQALVPC